jgi:hypothetical protein
MHRRCGKRTAADGGGDQLKLSKAQQKLYDELKSDSFPERQIECLPGEWRTAKALERCGLITVIDKQPSSGGFFEVQVISEASPQVVGEGQTSVCEAKNCSN